jgi:hypothetical protein
MPMPLYEPEIFYISRKTNEKRISSAKAGYRMTGHRPSEDVTDSDKMLSKEMFRLNTKSQSFSINIDRRVEDAMVV